MTTAAKRSRYPTEADFLKNVANHEMQVFKDDGLYRHLRFSNPKSWAYGFDVVTWPGFLAYTGDCGSYLFSRLPDMLEFFRRDTFVLGPGLHINPGYWGEKVQAVDRNGPLEEYDPDKFRAQVEKWMDDGDWPHDIREAVAEDVLSRADDGEHEAMRAAMEFSRDNYEFIDFWECSVREVGSRFIWCCFALAWAVRWYDASKAATGAKP